MKKSYVARQYFNENFTILLGSAQSFDFDPIKNIQIDKKMSQANFP